MFVKHFHKDKKYFVCDVCPHHCKLSEGDTGICFGRNVVDNRLIVSNFLEIVASHLDPIEKKPLYHFYPSKDILSVGPNGCNLTCKWCQNCDISQRQMQTQKIDAEKLAVSSVSENSIGLAYTYSEPLIWHESILEIAPMVRESGGKNVLVTNGYGEVAPLKELLPWIDAANVDLKFINKELYRKHTKGDLDVVLRTILMMLDEGVHVELTHLIVSALADDLSHFKQLVEWIASVDSSIPLHISRYFPNYKWNKPPTDSTFLEQAREVASEYLEFIYVGNIGGFSNDTLCPSCGNKLILRNGYDVSVAGLDNSGNCKGCGRDTRIVMA